MKNINGVGFLVDSIDQDIVFDDYFTITFFFEVLIIAKLIDFGIIFQPVITFSDLIQKVGGGKRVIQVV